MPVAPYSTTAYMTSRRVPRRSPSMASTAAQVQTRHELRTMELGFPMADDPDLHEDLIEDFDDAAAAIVDINPPRI